MSESVRQTLARKESYDALGGAIAALESQIDAATNEHRATCEPLQTELERDDIAPERRIELRLQVMAANTKLEDTIAPLKKQIRAAEEERISLARKGISVERLEQFAAQQGTPEEDARLRQLKLAAETLTRGLEPLREKSQLANLELANERERRAKNRTKYDIKFLEEEAESLGAAWTIAVDAIDTITAQAEAIRKARIARLYAEE
jgi:hypothetical protein